jgi:hypothetical protein
MATQYEWELRNPDGGMLGMEFAHGVSAPTDVILAHSLPERVDVVVRDEDEHVVAKAEGLSHPDVRPMSRLRLTDGRIERENVWPTEQDLGRLVILPGGEIGELLAWWNAEDGSQWRWRVEFSNAR